MKTVTLSGDQGQPVQVPAVALEDTPEGQEFWQGVASGSVLLTKEQLDALLASSADRKDQ